jgi:hypothetical protein
MHRKCRPKNRLVSWYRVWIDAVVDPEVVIAVAKMLSPLRLGAMMKVFGL